ncbi:Smr/MutS family protein [Yoonia sp. 208BN28-4]|uniref:Smr/MutS family protein n=1 Tax=Yoonia sp. 208BN28-4 TaxID=3126505 RepID=UPI00309A332A
MRRPRHLSQEERALWDQVAGRTIPLDPARPVTAPEAAPSRALTKQKKATAPEPISTFRVGERANGKRPHDILPGVGQRLATAPVQMDAKSYGKMTRGKIKPEGRIDLHGMTVSEAHPELVGFILNAFAAGKRLVLVITGKGKDRDDGGPIPVRQGVLRHQVPQWMALPPLKGVILQVTPAHFRHGGHGAYYVYLRRAR